MTKMVNSVLLVSAKTKTVGGTMNDTGTTCVSRFKGRVAACERRDQHHYDNGFIILIPQFDSCTMSTYNIHSIKVDNGNAIGTR